MYPSVHAAVVQAAPRRGRAQRPKL